MKTKIETGESSRLAREALAAEISQKPLLKELHCQGARNDVKVLDDTRRGSINAVSQTAPPPSHPESSKSRFLCRTVLKTLI